MKYFNNRFIDKKKIERKSLSSLKLVVCALLAVNDKILYDKQYIATLPRM